MTDEKEEVQPSTAMPNYRISGTGYVIKAGTGERVEFTFNNDPIVEEKTDADS